MMSNDVVCFNYGLMMLIMYYVNGVWLVIKRHYVNAVIYLRVAFIGGDQRELRQRDCTENRDAIRFNAFQYDDSSPAWS